MVLLANSFPWYINRYALLQACVKWRFFIIFAGVNEWNVHVSFIIKDVVVVFREAFSIHPSIRPIIHPWMASYKEENTGKNK